MIVTPKLDLALEQAFREEGEPFDVAVYMAPGTEYAGRFVHLPWGHVDPQPITTPNEYTDFPIVTDYGELTRTVIVRISGAVDDLEAGYRWKSNFMITEDHYIDYLGRRPAEEVVPTQILAKLRQASCLFLGYSIADWRLRVFLHWIWQGERLGGATHWAVEHDPDVLERQFWQRSGVRLYRSPSDRLRKWIRQIPNRAPRRADMSETRESVEPRGSPYFGLDYYEEKFGAWFFGRETEGSKIITNLRAARLTLLHAESGVGKSSLLRAGVAWRMRKLADDSLARRGTARSVPIVFSSWKDDPVVELAGTIRAAIRPYLAGRPEPELQTDQLDAAVGAASDAANTSLLIMLDQFEEYFLYRSREPTPERFADELARCINRTDLRANFLIAIREDAYAGLGDLFKGRIANVYGNYLHVDYLDRASAEKAIREPLDIYNSQP